MYRYVIGNWFSCKSFLKMKLEISFYCHDCLRKQEWHGDPFLVAVLLLALLTSTMLSLMFSSISQKNKASRQMKLHTHIHYYAPCPLLSAITDLYLLFTLGWTILSLCIYLCFLNSTSSLDIAIRQISCFSLICSATPDEKSIHIFFLFLHKNMLWVLIRSFSVSCFWWVHSICFHGEVRKYCYFSDEKSSLPACGAMNESICFPCCHTVQ